MRTVRICVYGIVQGVGFRPFVSRLADRIGIKGSVANRGSYVEIFAAGEEEQLDLFKSLLRQEAPERSAILKVTERTVEPGGYEDFQIIESEHEEGDIFVSPDIATCPKCRRELYDPNNRRYMHPFINCTACGPRLTILDAMPYDRQRTSMKAFPMCPECEYEYTHAETRRYDAQPVCCNDCGPEVYIIGSEISGRAAITYARQAIIDGKIIAIKGIGGFHLCCDATNEEAVARLRTLKRRPAKPFAVMARDLETVERECQLPGQNIRDILDGHQKPIILLKRKNDSRLAPSVAPDNPKIGMMLPYAPVQMLLFDYNDGLEMTTDCFVMTSGNVSGAPICRTDEDAIKELSGFCDIMLSHNRTIRLRADDSVMDIYRGEPYMIRRSRGYAPLPVMTEQNVRGSVLAVGGELKNTFCIGKDQLLYESPYVGDMEDLRTVQALEESIKRMAELLETSPTIVACDLHPKYNTGFVAERQGLPVMKLQHHYAHILSCMAENDYSDRVIGLSLDGTGYGTDGTIWGGELLSCDLDGFERIGCIEAFDQVGGDASAKEGWRIAASMINSIYGEEASEVVTKLGLCDENARALIARMAERGINTVKSTSAGRLFDAVSAILGVRKSSSFEGEAATTLMFRAQAFAETAEALPEVPSFCGIALEDFCNIRTTELVRYLIEEKLKIQDEEGNLSIEEQGRLAYVFHEAFAEMCAEAAIWACSREEIATAALSGGVFQNTLLLEGVESRLENNGIKVLRHHMIPPNDGGIALGQAAAAMHKINREDK
ncbi:MAG: carbamoyltransferase HypF [Clostridiales bacterium]|nr:carbamoyltransferase HypF [Candidatus Crickella merdequi]